MYAGQKGNVCPSCYPCVSRAALHAVITNFLGEHELNSFCITKRKTIKHLQYGTIWWAVLVNSFLPDVQICIVFLSSLQWTHSCTLNILQTCFAYENLSFLHLSKSWEILIKKNLIFFLKQSTAISAVDTGLIANPETTKKAVFLTSDVVINMWSSWAPDFYSSVNWSWARAWGCIIKLAGKLMQEMASKFDWFKNLWIYLFNPFELNLVPKKLC